MSFRKKYNRIGFAVIAFLAAAPVAPTEAFRYEPHGRRDPFVPLIGQQRGAMPRLRDVTSVHELNLEGIAAGSGGKRMAVMNGEMLRENEKVGEIEVKKITSNTVTVLIDGNYHIVRLPEEGGAKE